MIFKNLLSNRKKKIIAGCISLTIFIACAGVYAFSSGQVSVDKAASKETVLKKSKENKADEKTNIENDKKLTDSNENTDSSSDSSNTDKNKSDTNSSSALDNNVQSVDISSSNNSKRESSAAGHHDASKSNNSNNVISEVKQSHVVNYSIASQTTQIIDVQISGNAGILSLHDKNNGIWTQVLSTSCRVGRNGITSNKREGDGKTPSGVYSLGKAFGVASNPGCTRSYLKVNSNHYWVDDSNSQYYNKLVDASQTGIQWSSAEHLADYSTAYKYAIAINYNTSCVSGKGSAIFLHCSTGGATAGCISVSQSTMIQILCNLRSDTLIYIH